MSDIEQTGTLEGEIVPEVAIEGDITPEVILEGDIQIPDKVAVAGEMSKIDKVTLSAEAWVSENNRHSQVVEIIKATDKSQVDLTPTVEQLEVFYEKDLTFVTKNQYGVVTVYAIGQKPLNDYTIQVTLTEVEVPDGTAIWGITVGTSMNPEIIAAKVEIDDELSAMSDNAIQNRVVATRFAQVETTIGNIDALLGTI